MDSKENNLESENSIDGLVSTKFTLTIPKSEKKDVIDEKYKIHLNKQLVNLNNSFCKYYLATNVDDNNEYFAIVFDNMYLHPIEEINKLSSINIAHLNNIITYALVTLSTTGSEHIVIIVNKYNEENTLEKYIADKGPISSEQAEKMIEQLTNLVDKLKLLEIYNAIICPQNIIVEDNELLFL